MQGFEFLDILHSDSRVAWGTTVKHCFQIALCAGKTDQILHTTWFCNLFQLQHFLHTVMVCLVTF